MARAPAALLALLAISGVLPSRVPHRAAEEQHELRKETLGWTIGGVPLHNSDALLRDRRLFVKHVKGEEVEGREHWIVKLRRVPSVQADTRENVEVLGRWGAVPFVLFKGTREELRRYLATHEDAVAVEPDVPMDVPGLESAVGAWHRDIHYQGTTHENVPLARCLPNMKLIGRDSRSRTGSGVHVYMVDTGINLFHTDFQKVDAAFELSCFRGRCSGFDCATNPRIHGHTCGLDMNGHGTHTASTAGGIQYGVAPHVSLHAVKVFAAFGRGSASWMLAGVDFVIARGEKPGVISMSLGGKRGMATLESALSKAMDSGFTVVVSAGNADENACDWHPAGLARVITVGSMGTGWFGKESESAFSNYGSCVDIVAPGENIQAAWSIETGENTRQINTLSGTSMACPHVSGVAAMILEENPNLTHDEVAKHLLTKFVVEGQVKTKGGTPSRRLAIGPSLTCGVCSLRGRVAILSSLLATSARFGVGG